jgi:hypothetical protein
MIVDGCAGGTQSFRRISSGPQHERLAQMFKPTPSSDKPTLGTRHRQHDVEQYGSERTEQIAAAARTRRDRLDEEGAAMERKAAASRQQAQQEAQQRGRSDEEFAAARERARSQMAVCRAAARSDFWKL